MPELTAEEIKALKLTTGDSFQLQMTLEQRHTDTTIPTLKMYHIIDGQRSSEPMNIQSFFTKSMAKEASIRTKKECSYLEIVMIPATPESLKTDSDLNQLGWDPRSTTLSNLYDDLFRQLKRL